MKNFGDPMQVLKFDPGDDCQSLIPRDPKRSLDVIQTGGFTGRSMIGRWEPLEFSIEGGRDARGDFFGLTAGTFAFSQRVRDTLGSLFEEVGEVLPILVNGVPHYALNVLRRVDALDLERSEYRLFYQDKISRIDRHVFIEERVEGESIFLIKQKVNDLFTTSGQSDRSKDFYRSVTEKGYEGLTFRSVWSAA